MSRNGISFKRKHDNLYFGRYIFCCVAMMLSSLHCGPADVEGNYLVNVLNMDNECDVSGWDEGEINTGINLKVSQDEHDVSLRVEGLIGLSLNLTLGDQVFTGTVSGNSIDARIIGTTSYSRNKCSYTYRVELDAKVKGDFMEGDLYWRAKTNEHSDCKTLDTCISHQIFNGVRPPG